MDYQINMIPIRGMDIAAEGSQGKLQTTES